MTCINQHKPHQTTASTTITTSQSAQSRRGHGFLEVGGWFGTTVISRHPRRSGAGPAQALPSRLCGAPDGTGHGGYARARDVSRLTAFVPRLRNMMARSPRFGGSYAVISHIRSMHFGDFGKADRALSVFG